MIKAVHYTDTNSVEVTWLDAEGQQTRCHSYDQYQMVMLREDLGNDITPECEAIIAAVLAAQVPLPAPVVPVPDAVHIRQAKLALLQLGLLDDVEAAVKADGRAAEIEWEYASEFRRDNPLIGKVAAAMGWDSSKLDELFIAAAAL